MNEILLTKAKRELYYWQYGSDNTNFSALLYTLFQKADFENRIKLNESFPEYCQAYDEWYNSEAGDICHDWK